ncbi:MAG: hypothetical protein WCD76_18865, partial [Pyrinomonadaceae bacterium]
MNNRFTVLINHPTHTTTDSTPGKSRRTWMRTLLLFSCVWLMLFATTVHAQQEHIPRVPSATAPGSPSIPANQSDKSVLPSRRYDINFDPVGIAYKLEALGPDGARGLAPNQIGVRRALELSPNEVARQFTNPDGTVVRVLALTSPGARGLRLHFEEFDLSEGDEVYVYGTEDDYVAGPYRGRGPQASNDFWTGTIAGETVVIEYHTKGSGFSFRIPELSHIFATASQPEDAPLPLAPLACEVDASCSGEVEKSAVARMVYVNNGGSFVCTGTLMNTTNGSFIPYFLTANHCISTQASASTLETYWFYQTTSCNSGILRSGIVHLTSGAQLLTTSQSADATLLQLFDNAPAGALFSGWDANERPVNEVVFGLHHPGGGLPPSTDSYLRRAGGSITNSNSSCSASGLVGGYFVTWTSGLTEPGSSGSGLWYTSGANHFLIGTLSCGPANPDCVTTFSLYGKFSNFFPLAQSFLAPPTPAGLQYYP